MKEIVWSCFKSNSTTAIELGGGKKEDWRWKSVLTVLHLGISFSFDKPFEGSSLETLKHLSNLKSWEIKRSSLRGISKRAGFVVLPLTALPYLSSSISANMGITLLMIQSIFLGSVFYLQKLNKMEESVPPKPTRRSLQTERQPTVERESVFVKHSRRVEKEPKI